MPLKRSFYGAFLLMCKICLGIFLSIPLTYAQDTTAIKNVIGTIENYHARMPAEKLYLQFDKPYYTTGDTVWFKVYLFNAATYTASKLSSKLYVELLNDSSRVINRFAVPLIYGLGQGNIVLDEKVTDGNYTVRAYTNWMQNFGEETFFNKQFYIGKPSAQGSWLINEQHTIKTVAGNNRVELNLQLSDLAKMPVPYRDIELKLTDGKRTFAKSNLTTGDNGITTTSFALPDRAESRKMSVVITDKTTKNKYNFPFYPGGKLQDIDLQFMPEGGSIVAGIANKVAFKAVGEDGLGTEVKGNIYNSKNEIVTDFATLHNGMGSFILLPQAGEIYTAKYVINGVGRSVTLPAVLPSGISLRVENRFNADTAFVYVRATPDVIAANKNYILLVQSGQAPFLGTAFDLRAGYYNKRIPKSMLASGIVSFTILEAGKPLAERRVFIDHHDRLKLSITTSADQYQPKDSIAFTLNVADAQGKPVQGNFTVSVTDDSFIAPKPYSGNIISRLLLTSELKGYVENPAWYFSNDIDSTDRLKALDNLMLTQGWTGFNWSNVNNAAPPKIAFEAEPANRLTGNLRKLFNKPLKGAKLNLFSVSKKYGVIVFDTVSNNQGEFVFDNLPLLDTIAYTLKIKNAKGKETGATINLNEFKPAAVSVANSLRPMPWYAHMNDNQMLSYFNRPKPVKIAGLNADEIKGTLLKGVTIKDRAHVDAGKMSGYVVKEISEKQLVEAGKMSLLDLLNQKVKGFGMSNAYRPSTFSRIIQSLYPQYVVGMDLVADLIVDGKSMNEMYNSAATGDPQTYVESLRTFLGSIGADDVKNIKVANGINVFITITTRSGNGIFTQASLGIVPYRPVPLCLPRQFYRPRYTASTNTITTIRPTIHWEPNVVTDTTGKATLSFYAAEKRGTYTFIVEGADMAGSFGCQTGKIMVGTTTAASKSSK